MLRQISHGDVHELRFSTLRSRTIRYAVSAFVHRGVLIDSGPPDGATELGAWLPFARLDGAILTHGHEDHAGNLQQLADRDIPIQMVAGTDALVRNPGHIGWYRRYAWGRFAPFRGTVRPFTHDALAMRPTPGHSPDHHVVWDAERSTVFGGDLFIGVKVRIAHSDEDIRGQIRALREVASWHPERYFDSHRGRLTDPVVQLRAKADWIEETIAAIESRVQRGWDDRAIRDDVLGREDLTGLVSFGDYSRINFVRSIRNSMASTD
jgi:glyoxylase-like metal-dependent hydrolase (beta-lactamase superfamily II)